MNEEMIFFCDLHIHTHYSLDSLNSPDSVIRTAKKMGLSIIAITDHNTITGGLKVKGLGYRTPEIIVGSEIKTDIGEVIGLFLQEEILPGRFDEVIDAITDQGGISILPHPFRNKCPPMPHHYSRCNAIEGLNGRTDQRKNQAATKQAIINRKAIVAGSDAHFPFEIGSIINQVSIDNVSDIQEEIRKKIISGQIRSKISRRYPWAGLCGYYLSGGFKRIPSLKNAFTRVS